jgi:hypothetical protein
MYCNTLATLIALGKVSQSTLRGNRWLLARNSFRGITVPDEEAGTKNSMCAGLKSDIEAVEIRESIKKNHVTLRPYNSLNSNDFSIDLT